MGIANSKTEKNEALRLCKERRRFIKQAIDSRYSLAAAHVSYIKSLRNIGIALRRYAEAEVFLESSLSTSATTELEKTPSPSPYPSPSPPHMGYVSDSPLPNQSPNPKPISVVKTNLSYMKTGNNGAVTIRFNPSNNVGLPEEDLLEIPPPPPPPPHFESGSSWDFFDTSDVCQSFRFVGQNELDVDFDDIRRWEQFRSQDVDHAHTISFKGGINGGKQMVDCEARLFDSTRNADEFTGQPPQKQTTPMKLTKEACEAREDSSEYITHRAKDFLSSIKAIEHRFFRASESGREVSRMLEENTIRVRYAEAKASSSPVAALAAFQLVCCTRNARLASYERDHHVAKVIIWKRTTSSMSSSSRNPLAPTSKDDTDESGSDFIEEFCMIAGSHSSTLDRLYAWERKLYDEVKASECIRKVYDRKCDKLRHQFAKDQKAQVMDKTRAIVKDLHSRIRVAIHSVDSISKRIEKMRDEELQPQLMELIQGLIRMWKAMLECHHNQYITISLAYHSRSSTGIPPRDTNKEILFELQQEVECFGLSFANWVNSLTSYVEALNGWLQHCIMQPQGRTKLSRRPFSPRRVLAPPIFVLCRDWSAGIKDLPSEELSIATKSLLSDLTGITMEKQIESVDKKQNMVVAKDGESEGKDNEKNNGVSPNLFCIHASLTKVLDRLHKFSEASLKMYEDVKQKSETARVAYSNGRPTRF